MHGIICKALKDFVLERYDEEAWVAIHREAGLPKRIYVPVTEYPDEVVVGLVEAAVELTGIDADTLLYEFGRFIVPQLVEVYGVHVDRDWTAMELIANVEDYIHEALRANRIANFTPPKITSTRIDDRRVLVAYESNRGLCAVAEGVLVGVGDYYDERFVVDHRRCVHDGAERCELIVTRAPATTRASDASTTIDSARTRRTGGEPATGAVAGRDRSTEDEPREPVGRPGTSPKHAR